MKTWRRVGPQGLKLPAALTRPCPKCGAGIGHSCLTKPGGRVRGQDIGGGHREPMRSVHPERKHNPAIATPDGPPIAAPVDVRSIPWTGRNSRLAQSKVHVLGGCSSVALDTARAVPAEQVPADQRCGRPGCRARWPE